MSALARDVRVPRAAGARPLAGARLKLGWGKVKLTLWTHEAGGLTENDFVLAARVNAIARS
jgi:hypothetical protein